MVLVSFKAGPALKPFRTLSRARPARLCLDTATRQMIIRSWLDLNPTRCSNRSFMCPTQKRCLDKNLPGS